MFADHSVTLLADRTESCPLAERDFVFEYARHAPLALALERALECRLLADYTLRRPVLDIGCGDGLFCQTLYGRGRHIDYGLDLDADECSRARERDVYGSVLNASAMSIPLPDGTMRTVLSNSTLEHLPDLSSVLRECVRVLAPGGDLYVTVPTDQFDRYTIIYRLLHALGRRGAAERFRTSYDSFWRHFHYYPPDEWVRLLQGAGLRVDEVVEYDSKARCALHDALVPLALPGFIVKKLTGRYSLVPPLRASLLRLARRALPEYRAARLPQGTGGLVMLHATKP